MQCFKTTMETNNDTMNKIRCSNCKCWRLPEQFIGKTGLNVKRCTKCREKDQKQKRKPHVIEKRNERQREKKYYIKHRENKRKDNEEAYLKHNAEIAKNWREQNKEHLAKWQTKNFKVRFGAIKQQAKLKKLVWDENMTNEVCEKMMKSNCVYCGFLSEHTLNGIDRMDSQQGYVLSNCVSCCRNCNFIKKCLDPITFISRCKHISHIHGEQRNELSHDVWCDSKSVTYNTYMKRANDKNLDFTLTKDMFITLTSGSCFYCSKSNTTSHQNGIDRKNNDMGYTEENCVTCCGECNQMKANLCAADFIQHCKLVSSYKCTITFDTTMTRTYKTIKRRNNG